MENKASKQKQLLHVIVTVGFMAALVYVGNYMQIKIPNGVFITTRIHLGNSMCLLAGLLFGGMSGGLSSGIGAAMFDLFDPVYIVSAPYTFLSKFAMGFTAGVLRRSLKNEKAAVITAAVTGQLVYIFLYLLKSYLTVLILGGTHEAALTAVSLNALTSCVNAALAVIIAVPLYYALSKALRQTSFYTLIARSENKTKSERIFNPLTIALTVFAIVTTVIFSANLAASNKAKDKEKELIARIEVLESKVAELVED